MRENEKEAKHEIRGKSNKKRGAVRAGESNPRMKRDETKTTRNNRSGVRRKRESDGNRDTKRGGGG